MSIWRDWYRLESEDYINIDLLRFVASAGVVFYHFYIYLVPGFSVLAPLEAAARGLNLFVDVFFVISGIIIHQLYANKLVGSAAYLSFLRKRMARLVPLHYATLAFYLLLAAMAAALSYRLSPQNFDLACLAPQLTLTHAWGLCHTLTFNGPSWSVSAEMGVYLLAPMLFAIGAKGWWTLAVVAGALLASLCLPDGGQFFTRTNDFGLLRAIPAFAFGSWLSCQSSGTWVAILGKVPLMPACVLFMAMPLVVDAPYVQLALAYALSAMAFARDLSGSVTRTARRFGPLGRLTYSVYMLQAPVITLVVEFLGHRILRWEGPSLALLALTGMCVILPALGIVSLQLFEMPARRWITGSRRQWATA